MSQSHYPSHKQWRLGNADVRNEQKKRNYSLTQRNGRRGFLPWTQEEDAAILAHAVSDRELSEQIGRSVQAIQVRRSRLQPAPNDRTEPLA